MKPKGIFIRLTKEDKQVAELEAQKLGLSVTAFFRLLLKQWSDGIRFERRSGAESEHGRHTKNNKSSFSELVAGSAPDSRRQK